MYTNGTLINDEVAKRISSLGNLIPAISVEGWREKTDARRGEGMFDKIEAAMSRLFNYGVPFGISLTATRQNCDEILSDEFVDHFFFENHAVFGWIFQYMPIGRSYALELMPTPEQRIRMWKRSLEIIREKKVFLADFWNHGSLCEGCLSAGGSDAGGYLYIDWNGTVSPCVFVPYSPVNIKDVYAKGGTLTDAWKEPFFDDIRKWQFSYKQKNMMAPCINRDHHEVLDHLIAKHEPTPSDENARQAMLDPEYSRMLETYSVEFQRMADEIWKTYYTREPVKGDGKFGELPDLSKIIQNN
jgi:MoaA/NifB/PqqE/SkfB family radical SAM enzyme